MKENSTIGGTTADDANHLNWLVKASNKLRLPKRSKKKRNSRKSTVPSRVVNLDSKGTPVDLLGGGEHFNECPPRRLDEIATNFPMDKMMKIIKDKELTRPVVK